MKMLIRFVAAALTLAAAGSAAAYNHETTVGGDPTSGNWVWWGRRQVSYTINATSLSETGHPWTVAPAPCGDSDLAVFAVTTALASWSNAPHPGETAACTDFTFEPTNPLTTSSITIGATGPNLIVFRGGECSIVAAGDPCLNGSPGACVAKFNCFDNVLNGDGTIGLTTNTYADTGEILTSGIEFNSSWSFDCTVPGSLHDLQAVATHEAGHMLGLDHVCVQTQTSAAYRQCDCPNPNVPCAVMQPTVGSVAQRTLADDDVNGVCGIYPVGKATLTGSSGAAHSKGGGCDSSGGLGVAGLLLAGLSTLRLRRKKS